MIDRAKNELYQSSKPKRERLATQCVCCGNQTLKKAPAVLMPFVAHRAFDWAPVVIDESWGLSTIKSGNAYTICKSLLCCRCGLIFLDIRFSDEELAKLYEDYRGARYTELRELYEPGYAERNIKLEAGVDYLPDVEAFLSPHLDFPLAILDWGGNTGQNTPFKDRSKIVHIYDISNKEAIASIRVVKKEEALANKYKLIVCSSVLEHAPYPLELLWEISEVMLHDTILYIEVPLEDIMLRNEKDLHILKKHWHEHINFFSETSLRHLIENAGLTVLALNKLKVTAGGKSSWVFQLACKRQSSELHDNQNNGRA
jgi:hypothetical protein